MSERTMVLTGAALLMIFVVYGAAHVAGGLVLLGVVGLLVFLRRENAWRWFNQFFDTHGNFRAPSGGFVAQAIPATEVSTVGLTVPPQSLGWIYRIRLPKETAWNADLAVTLINKLFFLGHLILRIQATQTEIVWQIIDLNPEPSHPDELKRAIRAAYLDAEVSDPEPLTNPEVQDPYWRRVDFYFPMNEFARPSLRAHEIKKTDPITAIVHSLVDLQEGESVSYLVAMGNTNYDPEAVVKDGIERITKSKAGAVALDVLAAAFSQGNVERAIGAAAGAAIGGAIWGGRPPKYDPETMQACGEKLVDIPHLRCFVAVEVNARTQERLQHFQFFMTFFQHLSTPYHKFVATDMPGVPITNTMDEQRTNVLALVKPLLKTPVLPLDRRACLFTTAEIAALWHMPHDGMTASEIVWIKGKQVAAPVEFRGEREGVLFGVNKPTKAPIYQPLRERTTHTLVIGRTGAGKTSFMHSLVEQDIRAGNGVAVIDPVGNFVRRILQHSIPPERERDVVVLDIDFAFGEHGEMRRYPPPMNLISRPPGVEKHEAAFQFASVLGKLFSDIDQTRWIQTLEAALLTLAADEHPTLLDIRRVIQDNVYRASLLRRLDFSVAQLWEDIELSGGLDKSSLSAIIWRLNHFTLNPTLQVVTCHPQPLDIAALMRKNKILLVSVAAEESQVPESARNVLGAIILAQIQMAALGGAVADPQHKPFMLYVDEVQNFVTSSLDTIARQARQKGLGLVVSTQYTKAIAPKTLKALEGNIGTLVAFECDGDDAESAIGLMPAFSAADLINQGRFKAAVSMRSSENGNRASFSLDPVAAADVSTAPMALERERDLRRQSVDTYTPMTYDDVKAWLDARYRPQAQPSPNTDDPDDFGNPITN